MSYCTQSDILDQIAESRLIQLTDDEGLGTVNAERVAKAIADADEEIDGYVGSRYAVPLSPVPGIIRKCSVDLAIWNLYARRDKVPEARAERYKNAVRFLDQVAKGTISMGANDPDGSPPETMAPELSSENPLRQFTRDSMRGF